MILKSPHACISSLIIVLLVLSATALAQKRIPDRGLKPGRPFSQSDVDSINLTNGKVFMSFPLASLPKGRGDSPDFPISLNYNSKIWDMRREERFDGSAADGSGTRYFAEFLVPADDGGWSIGVGYRLVLRSRRDSEPAVPCDGSVEMQKNAFTFRLELRSPDGTERELRPAGFSDKLGDGYFNVDPNGTVYQWNYATVGGDSASCSMTKTQMPGDMTYYTVDGSHLRVVVRRVGVESTGADNPWSLYSPDGIFVENLPGDDVGTLQRMTDRNGNRAYLRKGTFNGGDATIVEDDLGRRTVIRPTPMGHSIFRAGFGGELLETKIEWKTVYVRKTYNAADVEALNAPLSIRSMELYQPMLVVGRIVLPHQAGGLEYSFEYNGSDSRPSGTYTTGWGELTGMSLPSGAKVAYRYQLDESGGAVASNDVVRNPISRRTLTYMEENDGKAAPVSEVKTYAIGSDSSVVTEPDGNPIYTRFVGTDSGSCDGGLILSTKDADGSLTENLWVNRCADPYVQLEFKTLADSSGNPSVTSATQYVRDGNGNLLEKKEYGNVPYASVARVNGRPTGIAPDMPIVRSAVNTFCNPTPPASGAGVPSAIRLHDVIKSTEVRDGLGKISSRSEFEYDDPESRGNVIVMRRWDSTKGGLSAPDARGFRLNDANAVTTKNTYDGFGNIVTLIDARGFKTAFVYGDIGSVDGLYPTEKIQAAETSVALRTSSEFDFFTGLEVNETLLGNTANENVRNEYSYDALGRPLLRSEAVGTTSARTVRFEYDDAHRVVVTRADRDKLGDGKDVSAEHYDQLGRIRLRRELESPSDDVNDERRGTKVQIRYLIKARALFQLVSNPFRAETSDAASREASMGWKLARNDRKAGVIESQTFSGADLPAPWGSNSSSMGISSVRESGDLELFTDEAGKRRLLRRDSLGRVSDAWEVSASGDESVSFNGSPVKAFRTSYEYTPAGNLRSVFQGTQTRNFTYDSLSRMTASTNPESGTVTYQYDPNGNAISRTDARGVGTRMFYDALNRVVNHSYTTDAVDGYVASPTVTYSYDDYRVPFSKGRLTRVYSAATDERTLSFDASGNVTSNEQMTDGKSFIFSYHYNLSGDLIEQIYPSGRAVRSEYGDDGRVSRVKTGKVGANARTFASNFSYDASGAVIGARLGNGLWEGASFNPRLQAERVSLGRKQGASDLLDIAMSYGAVGNNGDIVGLTLRAVGSAVVSQNFGYDDINRLSSASETAGGVFQWRQGFVYDRFGNRRFNEESTSTLPRGCTSGSVQIMCAWDRKRYNPMVSSRDNRVVADQDFDSVEDYRQDRSGNVLKDPSGLNFYYDSDNRQVQIEDPFRNLVGKYSYDGFGRRIKKTTYVNNQPDEVTVFIYNAFGRAVAEYSNRIEPASSARVSYLTTDHLGTARAVSDQYGRIVSRHDYLPFGEEIERVGRGVDNVRRKFTGYERDNEASLDHAVARYYSFRIGRFTSPDPISSNMDPSAPQTLNRYSYVLNNPLKLIDPSGEDWIVNTGGDRARNPYKWVDRCATGQSCWTTIASDAGSGVRVYGTRGANDVSFYAANPEGQVNVDSLLSHPDSKVASVAMTQGVPEPYLSSRAATALYNLGVRYRARFPNDGNLVFTNGNASNGAPCVYASGRSCHSGHRGGDMDLRYMDAQGQSLIGMSASLSADPKRTRFIVNYMKANGFPESFSGNSATLGTNPASPGTARLHRNHLHIGIFDKSANEDSKRK